MASGLGFTNLQDWRISLMWKKTPTQQQAAWPLDSVCVCIFEPQAFTKLEEQFIFPPLLYLLTY